MKILHVSTFALPDTVGGTQVLLSSLSRTLRARGHDVTVFRHAADPGLPEYAVSQVSHAGMEIVSVNHRFGDCADFRGIYRNDRIDRVFAEVLAKQAPDVVHVHHLTCLSTGMLDITRALGVPTVLTLFDFWLGCPRGQRLQDDLTLCETIDRGQCVRCCSRLWPAFLSPHDPAPILEYDRWIRRLLAQVDVLVTLSRNTRDEYLAWGIDRPDIRIVEPGLDHGRFVPRQRRCDDTFRVAYIGTVIPSKGVHVAIDAVQQLDSARFSLAVHGADPGWHADTTYGQRLRASDRGTHRISFHGRYDNDSLPGLLSGVDVLVVPSLWHETYCLTIREGFLAGVPVIASRVGAMAEGIRDGETGLLFTRGDAADLAAKIRMLADDPALYERLATSRKAVPTTEQMTDAMLAVYAGAIG